MRSPNKPGGQGGTSSLSTLLFGCAATLFIASRLWVGSREVVHLRSELAALQAGMQDAGAQQQQLANASEQSSPSGAESGGIDPLLGGLVEGTGTGADRQPLLYYSVRSQHPLGPEPPALSGPSLEADPLPLGADPAHRLLGQVNSVEAGRVHGWACVKGALGAALSVTVYVDGVRVGSAQAALPTQTARVRRLCQLDAAVAAAQGAAGDGTLAAGGEGVGFVVPLPALSQGLHVLRVFVTDPGGAFRQELNQSPLLFRESAISPDQEERIRRKDAIIQTRNAQVASLWDELHTKMPWRNAVGGKPIQPFPDQGERERRERQRNGTDLVLFIGVNTGLTSRKRRDILRRTWVPHGRLDEIEARLGVRIRFFVGYSQQRGDAIERELQAEMQEHGDMERLDVLDEYNELSRKTARLFSHMSSTVDADFYFKIDDDVAVNVEALAAYLRERREQGNLYLGCMKSGEVLTDKRWKWYEPEHWRFGDPAGSDGKVNYMRHASGQIYGMSRPVARYIAQNEAILHRYANEDVSVGAWLAGLDVVYDNQRRLCCDTEWKCTQQSDKDSVCLAFSENQCAGLCRSEERLEGIHRDCVLDPYGAGKKGKLPWWGQSGWATAARVVEPGKKEQGSTAGAKGAGTTTASAASNGAAAAGANNGRLGTKSGAAGTDSGAADGQGAAAGTGAAGAGTAANSGAGAAAGTNGGGTLAGTATGAAGGTVTQAAAGGAGAAATGSSAASNAAALEGSANTARAGAVGAQGHAAGAGEGRTGQGRW